jgi:hypothetical protein
MLNALARAIDLPFDRQIARRTVVGRRQFAGAARSFDSPCPLARRWRRVREAGIGGLRAPVLNEGIAYGKMHSRRELLFDANGAT